VVNGPAMDILLVASEFAPWVQNTGVAEVVASLSKTLKQVGHTVTVVVPHRAAYDQAGLLLARRLSKLKLADSRELAVYDTQLTSGIQLVLLDLSCDHHAEVCFEEAVVFAEAVAALINDRSNMGAHTDIVHVQDWMGSLCALAIEQLDGPRPPTVVTLHDGIDVPNAAQSPDSAALGMFGSSPRAFFNGQPSLTAAALRTAKGIITLSHLQARLLTDPTHGEPLSEELRQLGLPILGIPAGVDYARANPATDPQLPSRYDAEDSSQKATCKGALQKQLGLELDVVHPLLFITGPLLARQGHVVADLLPKLLDYQVSIVVGLQNRDELQTADKVRILAEQWKQRIAVLPLTSDQPNTLALGAADLVLLGEASSALHTYDLFALRYGAVPIANLSGAFADQLLDCDAKLQTGNCFAFDSWATDEVLGATSRAISAWQQLGFERLRRRIMRQDLGWERPTRRAIQLYRQVLGIKV